MDVSLIAALIGAAAVLGVALLGFLRSDPDAYWRLVGVIFVCCWLTTLLLIAAMAVYYSGLQDALGVEGAKAFDPPYRWYWDWSIINVIFAAPSAFMIIGWIGYFVFKPKRDQRAS